MRKFTNDIFDCIDLYVSIGEDRNAVSGEFDFYSEKDRDDFLEDNYYGVTCAVKDKNGREVVLVYFIDKESAHISTIAHESFHAADFMMDTLGIVFNKDCENEHVAYLIGWIARCIDNTLKELASLQ